MWFYKVYINVFAIFRREPPPALASNNEEVVNQSDKFPTINHNDNTLSVNDNEDLYDSFGNFVGDQGNFILNSNYVTSPNI